MLWHSSLYTKYTPTYNYTLLLKGNCRKSTSIILLVGPHRFQILLILQVPSAAIKYIHKYKYQYRYLETL